MDSFYFNCPFADKCWIRRHKILAILATFFAAILIFSLFSGFQAVCSSDEFAADSGCLSRFFAGSSAGFVYSAISWLFFIEDWTRPLNHNWLAYPFYVLPALVFFFARTNRTAIIAYVLFCILVCAALYSGLDLIVRLMP